ncbi:MAG: hypothetical protein EA417_08690 [Gammaproteobacteria bacterium]|nr:MAG: hypothetical protein EA417_08690 [Gammaproteobacteria bacterium]
MFGFKRYPVALLAAVLASPGAYAEVFTETGSLGPQGTQAGTVISNQARAEYAISGNPVIEQSNLDTFSVDERIQVDVTVQTPSVTVQGGQSQRLQPFLITNLGNGQERFSLEVLPMATAFTPVFASDNLVYRAVGDSCTTDDVTASRAFDVEADQLDLASGGTILICVPADIPADAADGEEGLIVLRAKSDTPGADGAGIGDALAGVGDEGVDAVVVQANGSDEDEGLYVVSAVDVTVVKSISEVADGFRTGPPNTADGGRFIPDAIVTYRLDVTVAGSGSVDNLRIIDDIPLPSGDSGIAYVPNSVVVDGAAQTDSADGDLTTVTEVTVDGVPHRRITVDFGPTSGDPLFESVITFQFQIQ